MFGYKRLFTFVTILLNIGYAAVIFGLHDDYARLLDIADFWLKVYIALYLLWRFNPFFPAVFTDFDRRIVFSAGLFMFTATIVESYLESYLKDLKDKAKNIFDSVKTNLIRSKPEPL